MDKNLTRNYIYIPKYHLLISIYIYTHPLPPVPKTRALVRLGRLLLPLAASSRVKVSSNNNFILIHKFSNSFLLFSFCLACCFFCLVCVVNISLSTKASLNSMPTKILYHSTIFQKSGWFARFSSFVDSGRGGPPGGGGFSKNGGGMVKLRGRGHRILRNELFGVILTPPPSPPKFWPLPPSRF